MNETIIIEEQGLRDGLQTLAIPISTEQKLKWIDKLVTAGVQRIQVASFVHPKLVPQMADAEAICQSLNFEKEVIYSGLALNLKGVERGIAAGLRHLSCSISASDAHSKKNARLTLKEARTNFSKMIALCRSNNIIIRGGIQCAFGCRYEGKIAEDHVIDMVKMHLDSGIDELALADSTGMGNPAQVTRLMQQIVELSEDIPVVLHLHNTENKGYANLVAAVHSGVRIFDTAFGGLGGCPFIKGATGNIATEDTIHLLHQMGYQTSINVSAISEISQEMEEILGHELPGLLYKLNKKGIVQ